MFVRSQIEWKQCENRISVCTATCIKENNHRNHYTESTTTLCDICLFTNPGAKVRVRRGIARKLVRLRHATPLFRELTRRAQLRDEVRFRAIARKNNKRPSVQRCSQTMREGCAGRLRPFTRVLACING